MAADSKPATKTEILKTLADNTGLSKKDVSGVLDQLMELVKRDLGKKGPGLFTIPGMVKFKLVQKPATKPRPGINPQTKEPIMIPAKPARKVVKAYVLKGLKELVAPAAKGK
jgi:nucleoid DNA-binding protein